MTLAESQMIAQTQKSGLQWKSFSEGLVEAEKTKKKILLAVYTDWCGWCKKMDKEVYADNSVEKYIAEKYVVIKLNAESDAKLEYQKESLTQRQMSHAFGVTGYPSTIFLQSDGQPITIVPGFIKAETFLDVLTFIGEDLYEKMKWEEFVERKKK